MIMLFSLCFKLHHTPVVGLVEYLGVMQFGIAVEGDADATDLNGDVGSGFRWFFVMFGVPASAEEVAT